MDANFAFERPDSLGDGRGGQIELARALRNRAQLDHSDEALQEPHIHANKNYLLNKQLAIFCLATFRPNNAQTFQVS
jgi:hypothetical protein